MLKRLGLGLLSLLIVGCAAPALSQPSGISQKVAVCDPKFANNCIKPTSGGAVPVTGTVTASTTVRSTAAAPAEVEGTDNPASGDLHGSNRSVILDAAGTAVDWTLPVVVKGNGTAGTADSAPVTVQGIASMTPILSTLQTQTDTVMVGGVNVKEINAVTPLMGNGVTGTGSQRVTIASDNTAFGVNATLLAGSALVGDVALQSRTTGGDTGYGLQTAASTNSTLVSTGAHTLRGMNLINTSTTIYYLRMYDSAGAPTCSSATGYTRTWPIPPAAASGGAGGIAVALSPTGVAFTTGLSFCVTGGPTSTDNTNAATGVFINLDYK